MWGHGLTRLVRQLKTLSNQKPDEENVHGLNIGQNQLRSLFKKPQMDDVQSINDLMSNVKAVVGQMDENEDFDVYSLRNLVDRLEIQVKQTKIIIMLRPTSQNIF